MTKRGLAHNNARSKRERLEARVNPEQKALFQRAADLQGRTLSDFVVGSAQRAAEEVVRAHDVTVLTVRESRAFMDALLEPPAPSPRLRVAAAQYKEEFLEH